MGLLLFYFQSARLHSLCQLLPVFLFGKPGDPRTTHKSTHPGRGRDPVRIGAPDAPDSKSIFGLSGRGRIKMNVPKYMLPLMRGLIKVSIPMTYLFMIVGVTMAIFFIIQTNFVAAGFGFSFAVFAFLHRIYCLKVLDSLERTGTTYKWRWKT